TARASTSTLPPPRQTPSSHVWRPSPRSCARQSRTKSSNLLPRPAESSRQEGARPLAHGDMLNPGGKGGSTRGDTDNGTKTGNPQRGVCEPQLCRGDDLVHGPQRRQY